MPNSEKFGVLFGRLVREKRGVEGLSQDALAGRSELTKARISDLENGKIGNPQARTVDALCVALNISPDERASCHRATVSLPPLLLENLAFRFGHRNPNALEEDLAAFLRSKADEFSQMQARLARITQAEGRVAELLGLANEALEAGDFQRADERLAEAEELQLSTTLAALEGQSELRIARGHAALLASDVDAAAAHWETAASLFHFLDRAIEAEKRYAYADELRGYGYRYRSTSALLAAKTALERNLSIWTKVDDLPNWCRATNALGGVHWRLSQFDQPANFLRHCEAAQLAYESVREATSETVLPRDHARSGGNLASLYSERGLANSDAEFRSRLADGLQIRLSALKALSPVEHAEDWGIIQHNIGYAYTQYFKSQINKRDSLGLLDLAVKHLMESFDVRGPVNELQYWIASCRSLAEAIIEKANYESMEEARNSLRRAHGILIDAASKISAEEHPNQWAQLHEQIIRCSPVVDSILLGAPRLWCEH